MKIYFSFLLTFISINIFAQANLCQECEVIRFSKEFKKKCIQSDTTVLEINKDIYVVKDSFLCEEKKRFSYFIKQDTIPYLAFIVNKGNDTLYTITKKTPEFKGGLSAMIKFMQKNIIYPRLAERNKIEGRVLVTFSISTTGKVYDVKITKSVEESLDQESLRVIKLMPDWIPGEHDGKPVNFSMTYPIKYVLPE